MSDWETGRTQPDRETLGKLTTLYGEGMDRILYGVDYDNQTARRRKKRILASRVLAGMAVSVIWRLCLGSDWPPILNGVQDWWYAWYDYHETCAGLFRIVLALLILDAAVGDIPKLGRHRGHLRGGRQSERILEVVRVHPVAGGEFKSRHSGQQRSL